MNNKENFLEDFIDFIGVVSVVALTIHFIESIKRNTDTKLISNDGFKTLKNPEKAKQLRNEIENYHNSGNWNTQEIQSIIKND